MKWMSDIVQKPLSLWEVKIVLKEIIWVSLIILWRSLSIEIESAWICWGWTMILPREGLILSKESSRELDKNALSLNVSSHQFKWILIAWRFLYLETLSMRLNTLQGSPKTRYSTRKTRTINFRMILYVFNKTLIRLRSRFKPRNRRKMHSNMMYSKINIIKILKIRKSVYSSSKEFKPWIN